MRIVKWPFAKWTVDCYAIDLDIFLARDDIRFWTRRGAENWAQRLNETETFNVTFPSIAAHRRLNGRKLVFIVGRIDQEPGQGYPNGNPYGGEK